MVTQDTDKDFIQVRPPCGRNTSVVVAVKLLKPTVNVKPPAMAAKSEMMASCSSRKLYAHLLPGAPLSTKANRQSNLG